jgi:hypothetical protein
MSIHEDGGHRDFFARNGWSSNARLLKGARFIDVFFLGHFYFTLWWCFVFSICKAVCMML